MKSSGNSDKQLCMMNLLRIVRGEVRFDILRGMIGEIIDMPAPAAIVKLQAEAYWLIENYEPRIDFNGVDIESVTDHGATTIFAKS